MSDRSWKRVLVATACEDEKCDVGYTVSLIESVKTAMNSETLLFPVFFNKTEGLSMAINRALTACWQEKLDSVVFVASDISWSSELMTAILSSPMNVIAAPVSGERGFEVSLGDLSRLQRSEDGSAIKVFNASVDFLRLSGQIVSELCEGSPSINVKEEEVKLVIRLGDNYSSYHTEGEVLASRLFELGADVWLHTTHTASKRSVTRNLTDFNQALAEAIG